MSSVRHAIETEIFIADWLVDLKSEETEHSGTSQGWLQDETDMDGTDWKEKNQQREVKPVDQKSGGGLSFIHNRLQPQIVIQTLFNLTRITAVD